MVSDWISDCPLALDAFTTAAMSCWRLLRRFALGPPWVHDQPTVAGWQATRDTDKSSQNLLETWNCAFLKEMFVLLPQENLRPLF